jgi:hypothetical protein
MILARGTWIREYSDGVTGVQEDVEKHAEDGCWFCPGSWLVISSRSETKAGFNPYCPGCKTVDEGQRDVGCDCAARTLTPASA